MPYGTHSVLDTLAASQQTIAQFDEDRAFDAIDVALAAHNRIQADLVADLVEPTTDRLRRYGGNAEMTMEELDEFGRADAQKITAGANVGFPLRLYGGSLQWTRKFFQNTTGRELAASVQAMMAADTRTVNLALKRAIFLPTNTTFIDRLIDGVSLPVKALVNGDGEPIPPGPNGDEFDNGTHTHYLGTATLVAADVSGAIATVVEHYNFGRPKLFINAAQETAVRGFTDNFIAYQPVSVIDNRQALQTTAALDTTNLGDRAIGVWLPYDAEVVVKPWVPANYMVATVAGAPPPLAWRTRNGGGQIELVADDESHPLRARSYEREFGIGVWNRTNAAVLLTNNATYSAPTLTS